MSCDKYLDLISARLDAPLSPADEAELTAHLDTCSACRAIADDLANIHGTLSGCTAVPPAELAQGVMRSIRGQRTARRRTIRQLGALAACLVLCVGILRITDAIYFDRNRPTEGQTPMTARIVPDDTRTGDLSFSNQQRLRLGGMSTSFMPTADLFGSADGFSEFLARFPYNDFSDLARTYDEEYFRTHRLLAVTVWEPSSSVSHTVTALTEDTVTVLRTVPEAGDTDVALWLLLAEVEGTGPEAPLTVELLDSGTMH
ncbi:MAG: zf-HC2 domain-containing protein [Oscillospiraceae bacterium]|nr:zf-HC2 domain-containing protein [Oscillospiraceae bacterium]